MDTPSIQKVRVGFWSQLLGFEFLGKFLSVDVHHFIHEIMKFTPIHGVVKISYIDTNKAHSTIPGTW